MNNSNDINNENLLKSIKNMKADNTVENADTFINELIKTKFVLPISVNEENSTINPNGSKTLKEGSVIVFKSVVNTENDNYLIAFSDWQQLKNWNKTHKESVIITYKEISDIVLREASLYSGFVINPFSDNFVMNIKKIVAVNSAIDSGKPSSR